MTQPDQLALSISLTAKTNQLCLGLESGTADILELVTPTTAELLTWWFGEDMVLARGALNFHVGQKQAILNAIVAHEVLGKDQEHWSLLDLYRHCAPDALLTGTRLNEIAQAKHAHPKYCFKMATGTGKTWVLQALLIWQLLNKTAALNDGIDEARFTRQFMVVAPGLIVYERLLDAFCGKPIENGNGSRDFTSSDVARFADLFTPDTHRDTVFAFVRGNVCSKNEIGLNRDNPLGGSSNLHSGWRPICGHFERSFVVHSPSYELLTPVQTVSQLASPSICALMDFLG